MTTRILPMTLDYTDRDHDSLRLRLQDNARSVFPDWTDHNSTNFGNILLELKAFVGDTLHFYLDNLAAECFLATATQRTSMIRLLQLLGQSMRTATAATADETFTIVGPVPTINVPIPRGTRLRSSDQTHPLPYQVLADTEINVLAGQTAVVASVEQSENRMETFMSTSEPNQELLLNYYPFLDGSIDAVIKDGSGNLLHGISAANGDYTRVESFLGYTGTDRVFISIVDHLDKCHLRFGNGAVGSVPQGEIKAGYKIGGGLAGNVESDRITILEDPITAGATPVSISVTNSAAATGGVDRMSIDEAREQAPSTLKTLSRTVSKMDYETVATSVAGVARALMVTPVEYPGLEENTGLLYVVAQGQRLPSGRILPASAPSTALLERIADEIDINKPSTITFSWTPLAAEFEDVIVSARIYLKQGWTGATVGANVEAALQNFFAAQLDDGLPNPDIDFGANIKDANGVVIHELAWDAVMEAIRTADGVRRVDEGGNGLLLNSRRQSLVIEPTIRFPRLTGVIVINAATNETIG